MFIYLFLFFLYFIFSSLLFFFFFFFFFNDTATTEIYTLSLHDALPILYSMITYFTASKTIDYVVEGIEAYTGVTIISGKSEILKSKLVNELGRGIDRKSTRLNSSHVEISYAVFCLKKKKKKIEKDNNK